MRASIIALLLLVLAAGSATAKPDVFDEIRDNAPLVDDTFVEIDRKSP